MFNVRMESCLQSPTWIHNSVARKGVCQLTAGGRVILVEKFACEPLFGEMMGWNSGKMRLLRTKTRSYVLGLGNRRVFTTRVNPLRAVEGVSCTVYRCFDTA
jgi:hypothetical protein